VKPLLPSWRPGSTRNHLVEFLDRVDDIPPRERVAVFDNDGTLWCEKPDYIQAEFLLAELRRVVAVEPAVAEREEYRALLEGDRTALGELGLERVVMALVDLHTGLRPDQFDDRVTTFVREFRHFDRGVPMRQLRFQPMLELIAELRTRGFDVYLVSGGGAEFLRVLSEDFYGVKPEGVVGTQIDYDLVRGTDGTVHLRRSGSLIGAGANEGPTKPTNIQRVLGRRPCVAGGNSAGDAEMLQYAAGYDGPSLSLLVNHDDGQREYAYASVAGTFDTAETILETAARLDWVVASIRDDWSTVFVDS
jgi:phosphoserine phosphatase